MTAAFRPRAGRGPPSRATRQLGTRHPLLRLVVDARVALGVIVVSAAGVAAFTVWDAATALGDNAVVLR